MNKHEKHELITRLSEFEREGLEDASLATSLIRRFDRSVSKHGFVYKKGLSPRQWTLVQKLISEFEDREHVRSGERVNDLFEKTASGN